MLIQQIKSQLYTLTLKFQLKIHYSLERLIISQHLIQDQLLF